MDRLVCSACGWEIELFGPQTNPDCLHGSGNIPRVGDCPWTGDEWDFCWCTQCTGSFTQALMEPMPEYISGDGDWEEDWADCA